MNQDPKDLSNLLEIIKRAMRHNYRHRHLPEHMRAWLDGEIDYETYRRRGRDWMVSRGWIWVAGEYWPQELFDRGALVVRDGRVAVVWVTEDRPDPGHPGRMREVSVLHPAWRRYQAEEDTHDRAHYYADRVAETMENISQWKGPMERNGSDR